VENPASVARVGRRGGQRLGAFHASNSHGLPRGLHFALFLSLAIALPAGFELGSAGGFGASPSHPNSGGTMTYLFAAYTAIWILLSWYLFNLSRRQKKVESELTRLEESLKKAGK
jgi:CcmD family protein